MGEMGPCAVLALLVVLLSAAAASAAGNSSSNNNNNGSSCLCQTASCLCCVELNLTSSIDLGGPACVNIRQLERNVSLNLSYADNPVHNATIMLDQAARKPTCMNLLSDLAQICAEFVSMRPAPQGESGYDGCIVIEPALLGNPQATYPVGCFRLHQGQVRQLNSSIPVPEDDVKPSEPEEEEDDGLNAEELIAAVSASAEQGIALFSQWLGLNLAPRINITSQRHEEPNSKPAQTQVNHTARHGRTITLLTENEDKNEERFKQLLSAQDNILKESATIGGPSSGMRTAFLYSQPEVGEVRAPNPAANISPENLAVVPTESRRGGRAYNIHQHVNEV